MTPPESHLVYAILAKYGSHPRLRIARVNTGAAKIKGRMVRFGVPGTADIVGLIAPHGRMLMIECKTAIGRQSKAQEVMQRVVTQFGGLYILARSVDDVTQALAEANICPNCAGDRLVTTMSTLAIRCFDCDAVVTP